MEKPRLSSIKLVASIGKDEDFDPLKCIICQKDDKTPLSIGKTGYAQMKRAAGVRNDEIAKRIRFAIGDEPDDTDFRKFVYHNTNKCYKEYTHSGKLQSIEETRNLSDEEMECESGDEENNEDSTVVGQEKCTTRRSITGTPCAKPSTNKDPRQLPCCICGLVVSKTIRDKFRICEYESAKKLIDCARHYHDEVFTRIADRLQDDDDDSVKSVISADMYCHRNCRSAYIRNYERDIERNTPQKPVISNIKQVLFMRAVPYIDKLLAKGECISMSDFIDFASSLLEEGEALTSKFRTRDMKQLIISHYGESVTIAPNCRVNESDIFFSSAITATDLAVKLKNQDVMKEAGFKLRDELMGVDFGLQDSFCDSADLKSSWERTIMPPALLTFLAALFNVPRYKLFQSSASDLEELLQPLDEDGENVTEDQLLENEGTSTYPEPSCSANEQQQVEQVWDNKSTQLHCLFQILFYNLHSGVKRTPLHMMLGHAIYARDRSKSLLTAFNRIGSCASYQTIRSARSLLASYAVKCSENGETCHVRYTPE